MPVGDLEANVQLHPNGDEVHGGVVMPKLGNATAKCVVVFRIEWHGD